MLPIIRDFFNDETIEKTKLQHHPFDYESSTCLYELKTRKCTYNRYSDTIFPTSKFNHQPEKDKVLIFSFTDNNYYIRYDKALFDTFHKEVRKYRYDRGDVDKPVEYINIPIEHLVLIS
jgi:predicted restriction endonuclease